jgi:hypothetical protein
VVKNSAFALLRELRGKNSDPFDPDPFLPRMALMVADTKR